MNIWVRIFVVVVMVSGAALSARASSIVMKNGRTVSGKSIEWREATHDYLVVNEGASMPVPEDQVTKIDIDRPAELDKAKSLLASRQFAQAIPLLEGMIKKYKKLSWDLDALKLQAQCYVEMNDTKKAAVAIDALAEAGGTMTPALQMIYWKALQKAGDTKRLQQELGRAMGTGAPDLAATAYLVRANMYLQDGDQDAALSDFLKIVTIFKGEKAAQPEALYNAADLLDKAKDPRAAELRKILQQDFKASEWAGKVKS
jgi:thioredoxin-like negative regulator of GroEL